MAEKKATVERARRWECLPPLLPTFGLIEMRAHRPRIRLLVESNRAEVVIAKMEE